LVVIKTTNRSHYVTNPNKALLRGNPENTNKFALFDSPKMDNLMIPGDVGHSGETKLHFKDYGISAHAAITAA